MAPNGTVKKYHILFNFLNQSSDFFPLSHQPGEEFSLSVFWELPTAVESGRGLEAASAQALGRALRSHTVHPSALISSLIGLPGPPGASGPAVLLHLRSLKGPGMLAKPGSSSPRAGLYNSRA